MCSEFTFRFLTSWKEIWDPHFLSEWDALLRRAREAHVFFIPAVVRAWAESQLQFRTIKPRFLCLYRGEEMILLCPMVLEQGKLADGWLRTLLPAGWDVFDYDNPLVAEAAETDDQGDSLLRLALDSYEKQIGREYDILRMPFLREGWFPRCEDVCRSDVAPYIELGDVTCLDEFLARLPSRFRQDVRREKRRLEATGQLQLKVCGCSETDYACHVLKQLLAFHSERWGYARDAAVKASVLALWMSLVTHVLPTGMLHVSSLTLDGDLISCVLSFVYGGRFYYYIPGRSEKESHGAPGKVHLMLLIEWAIKMRLNTFDLLRGEEAYKYRWTDKAANLDRIEKVHSGPLVRIRQGIQRVYHGVRRRVKHWL
jgi:CelD/BcsL family acetyltransferase involved in cellulose biosynthesis